MSDICFGCFKNVIAGPGPCPACGFDPDRDRETYPFALPHGSILAGRYITGRILGQGGFGITYLAQDYKTQGLVAIKEFFPESLAARSDGHTVSAYSGERGESFQYGKECFLTEARTLAEFKGSENIVNIHGYFEENGTAYFVMDFVEGISFQQYLRDRGGRIGWREAVDIMVPVMRALAAVHSRNIIHRDVTPDNIFITDTGTVKLLDFGAARYSVGDRSQSLDVVLKHGFAPKEQYVRRGKQGAYTDVYSAAATLYYAVTGRIPPDSIERADDDSIIAPSALGVSIPRNIEDAIFKGLEVQPPDRFQNMGDFIAALTESSGRDDEVEDNGGADDAEEDTDADPRERRGKKLPVWSYAAAAAAAVLVLVLGIRFFSGGSAKTPDGERDAETAANAVTPDEEAGSADGASGGGTPAGGDSSGGGKGTVILTEPPLLVDSAGEETAPSEPETKTVSLRTAYYSYDDEGDVEGYYIYSYNEYGEETESWHYNADGSLDVHFIYEYDECGNELRHCQYDSDGTPGMKTEAVYDADGKKVSYLMTFSTGSTSLYEYSYDDQGREIYEKSTDTYSDGTVYSITVYESKYDAEGNCVEEIKTDDGKFDGREEYKYDRNGNKIYEACYDENNELEEWTNYTYNENGKRTQYLNYEVSGRTYKSVDEYDAYGNETYSASYHNGETEPSSWSEHKYTYDSDGNMLNELYYYKGVLSGETAYTVTEIKVR